MIAIRSGQTQNRTVQTHLESSSQYSILVQFKACSGKELQFYQSRSHAIALFKHTTSDLKRKMVCMKTGEERYCKVYQSHRLNRVTLVPNSQHAQKDVRHQLLQGGPSFFGGGHFPQLPDRSFKIDMTRFIQERLRPISLQRPREK